MPEDVASIYPEKILALQALVVIQYAIVNHFADLGTCDATRGTADHGTDQCTGKSTQEDTGLTKESADFTTDSCTFERIGNALCTASNDTDATTDFLAPILRAVIKVERHLGH